MKKWINKNKKIILSIFLSIIIVPVIINVLFKINAPLDFLVAEWDASAILSYYGTIIAAIISIYGIFITIKYSQKSYKEDVRHRALPFLVIDVLKTKSYRNLSRMRSNINEQMDGYCEYKIKDYYCVLKNGEISFNTGLTKEQKELLETGGMKGFQHEMGYRMILTDVLCIPLEIENVGNGTAIRLRCGLNCKKTLEKDRKYLSPISLKPKTTIMFHIFSEDCSKESNNLGEYVLSFYYEDIYLNKYEQQFDIVIRYEDDMKSPVCTVDMSHVQNFLGGK